MDKNDNTDFKVLCVELHKKCSESELPALIIIGALEFIKLTIYKDAMGGE